jgi:hypothetical protein
LGCRRQQPATHARDIIIELAAEMTELGLHLLVEALLLRLAKLADPAVLKYGEHSTEQCQ